MADDRISHLRAYGLGLLWWGKRLSMVSSPFLVEIAKHFLGLVKQRPALRVLKACPSPLLQGPAGARAGNDAA